MTLPYPHADLSQSRDSRSDGKIFSILLALYFLILYPILRANRYYNDDLKRALIGHTGWDSNGRPLTTLLMKLLQCYDGALVDISPFTQIAAIAVLAWIGVLIARRYAIRSPWMAALVAFPLGAQPFYLENLSYKFDALSMSLAILLALLPVLVMNLQRRGWWLGVLSLFASLSFYQPAINVCLIFVLLDVVLAQLHGESVASWLKTFSLRVLQVAAAMLFYQLIIGIHIHGWVEHEGEKIHSLSQLPLIATNIAGFYRLIGNSFDRQWWTYFLPLLVVLGIFPMAIGVRYATARRALHASWISALLVLTSFVIPLMALLCIAGPMLLLLTPEYEPRVLMGVGALLVAALIVMHETLAQWQRSPRWTLAAGCMLAVGMCSLASAYGNALGEQKAYEDRIAAGLADDLADLKATQGIRGFLLDGGIGFSPITAHIAHDFPMVNKLVSPYISSQDRFHTTDFLLYYIAGIDDLGWKTDASSLRMRAVVLQSVCHVVVERARSAYALRVIDHVAVTSFYLAASQDCRAASGSPQPIRP